VHARPLLGCRTCLRSWTRRRHAQGQHRYRCSVPCLLLLGCLEAALLACLLPDGASGLHEKLCWLPGVCLCIELRCVGAWGAAVEGPGCHQSPAAVVARALQATKPSFKLHLYAQLRTEQSGSAGSAGQYQSSESNHDAAASGHFASQVGQARCCRLPQPACHPAASAPKVVQPRPPAGAWHNAA